MRMISKIKEIFKCPELLFLSSLTAIIFLAFDFIAFGYYEEIFEDMV